MSGRRREAVERLGDWVLGPDGYWYPPGIEFGTTRLEGLAVASDETLNILARDGEMRAERDEKHPYRMTADKLAALERRRAGR